MNAYISLDGLVDFINSLSLSAENQRWLAARLIENSEKLDSQVKAYTMEEINHRIDESEFEYNNGMIVSNEVVMQEMDDLIAALS